MLKAHLISAKTGLLAHLSRALVLTVLLTACKTTGSTPAAVSEWIPFDATHGSIKFDVLINGVRAKAILDSGSPTSKISQDFCKTYDIGQLGPMAQLGGFYGTEFLDFADPFNVDLVGQAGSGGAIRIKDAVITNQIGPGVDLVLGVQFFRRLIVQIDYPNRQFRLTTPNAIDLEAFANTSLKTLRNNIVPAKGMPLIVLSPQDTSDEHEILHNRDLLLLVRVEVGEESRWVFLDTGYNNALYLPRRTAKVEGWLRDSTPVETIQAGTAAEAPTVEIRQLPTLKIGPHTLEDIPLKIQTAADRRSRRPVPALTGTRLASNLEAPKPGRIGFDVLRHFVITIDHDRELMHLHLP